MFEPRTERTPGCGCTRRNLAIGILAVLLGITTTGWVMTATMRNRPAEAAKAEEPRQDQRIALPPAEQDRTAEKWKIALAEKLEAEKIEVFVAAKDLPVGTVLTKSDLPKFAIKKRVHPDVLPSGFVLNEEDLYDRRLNRPILKDETFNPRALTKGGVITLPEGMDMISVPLNVSTAVAGFVVPGSKVDVIATQRLGNELRTFPLLIDMLVLAVDTQANNPNTFGNIHNVSFAATQEQALLLALAKQRGCHLELLLRQPGKPVDTKYDIKKVFELLKDLPR